ncbi:MAG: hypothetical protein DRQ59_14060 [Gammaproteobacteria bacterium]|nr:MAG: hypothetical protein DRQ59_14060 [Gammaproteobacteria bacterium]
MHTKKLEKSFIWPVFASFALAFLLGCEEAPSGKPGNVAEVDVEKISGDESSQEIQQSTVVDGLETGQYLLQISAGKISLNSAGSSRIAILEDLAQRTGFELSYTGDSDELVLLNQPEGGMAELLEALLEGVSYQAEYTAEAGDNGFRLSRLNIGSPPMEYDSTGGDIYTQPTIDLAVVFPESTGEIFLGPDPDDADLATRLQFGSIEDKADAVSELTIDAAGLNAAYQVYTQTTSPEVRIAVLELIESEDNYLARSMIVLSLQSLDPEEAMVALSIVESLDDFSLVAQVEVLYSHHDAGVRELAMEVLESITSGFGKPDNVGATTVFSAPRDSSRIEGGGGAGDR